MINVKERVLSAAEARGHSASLPVIVALSNQNTNYNNVRFVVSQNEPHDVTSPLNVMWIVTDPNSADFGKVLRRSSRSNSGTYLHAWSEVLEESNFYVNQVWDLPEPEHQELYDHIALIGNPHSTTAEDMEVLPLSGGQLTGALKTRTLEAGEEYADDEAFPRSFLEFSLGPLRYLTSSLQMFFGNLNNQIRSVRNRTTVVEGRLDTVQTGMTTLEETLLNSAAKGFAYVQETPTSEWNIAHNLNTYNIIVQVFEGNTIVWPADIIVQDENNVKVTFAIDVAGGAKVLPIS